MKYRQEIGIYAVTDVIPNNDASNLNVCHATELLFCGSLWVLLPQGFVEALEVTEDNS